MYTKRVVQVFDVGELTVQNALKEQSFYSYKVHVTYELKAEGYARRVQFRKDVQQCTANDAGCLDIMIFSDEVHFYLDGHVTGHNCQH